MTTIRFYRCAAALSVMMSTACGDSGVTTASGTDADASTTNGSIGGTDTTTPTTTTASGGSDSDAGTESGSDSTPTSTDGSTGTTSTDTATTSGDTTETTDGAVSETTSTGGETTDATGETTTTTGETTSTTDETTTTTGGMMQECSDLTVTYRDHKPLHVDFGCHMNGVGARPGLVMNTLGPDDKPVYNPNPPAPPPNWFGTNPQITSEASFHEWYNTVPDVNMELQGVLSLTEIMPNIWSYSSNSFYPLNDQGFGNNVEPNWLGQTYGDRNGEFTTEIHTMFLYEAGQVFSFSGDDDVWVFVDKKLAMDLGGLHEPVNGSIMLDTLGLTEGNIYSLDVFHAERCGTGSNFRIDTSIACFLPQ
ncbi:fibro-slime domain-containing protein [Nannocystis sp. SCPEA4]|uniref:fibro-slime domain-containing protein n=1 Tax=Nannocystis sp. SCPEA4 TaxID=2996787 RepID=UPI00226E706F|nr:fibro-slime domain-containing protein [Nannocystis sp. SCPEA4]MCY1059297.1 fibro-slime domain-containing protein [Nannocystis sp. SCPEA4]